MKKNRNYIKLGIFTLAGTAFLILTLYLIGAKENYFKSTFTINATFKDVGGLRQGNFVRFAGIDVGTVQNIFLLDKNTVNVSMSINKKYKDFIDTNVSARIGTDGIVGNRLIMLISGPEHGNPIEDGGFIESAEPLDTDAMLKSISSTGENIAAITSDLKFLTQQIVDNQSLINLLADTLLPNSVKETLSNLETSGRNFRSISGGVRSMVDHVNRGEGMAGAILKDTALENSFVLAIHDLQMASKDVNSMTEQLNEVVTKIRNGEGAAGTILSDAEAEERVNNIMTNVEKGTVMFNENMEALRHNFLFRRYFRKKEKNQQ